MVRYASSAQSGPALTTDNSMRPIYETELDRTREDFVFRALADAMNFDYIGMPRLSAVDRLLCYKNGTLAALAELKIRTNRYGAYPTYLFSATKHSTLLSVSAALKVPAMLFVKFSDCTAFTILREGYDQKSGGRTDRGDHRDIETCVYIPMREFRVVIN